MEQCETYSRISPNLTNSFEERYTRYKWDEIYPFMYTSILALTSIQIVLFYHPINKEYMMSFMHWIPFYWIVQANKEFVQQPVDFSCVSLSTSCQTGPGVVLFDNFSLNGWRCATSQSTCKPSTTYDCRVLGVALVLWLLSCCIAGTYHKPATVPAMQTRADLSVKFMYLCHTILLK